MGFWNGVYYFEALVKPFYTTEVSVDATHGMALGIQPFIIDEGSNKGIIFPVITAYPNKIYLWHWNWESGELTSYTYDLPQQLIEEVAEFFLWSYEAALSFAPDDFSRLYVGISRGYSGTLLATIIDVAPILTGNEPTFDTIGFSYNYYTPMSMLGYAGGDAFVVPYQPFGVQTPSSLLISLSNSFPQQILYNYLIPYQHGGPLRRPLLLFNAQQGSLQPVIVRANGTIEGRLPDYVPRIPIPYCVGLSPHYMGYDFFMGIPHGLQDSWKPHTAETPTTILNWVKNETNYIFVKETTMRRIGLPAGWSALNRWWIKHIAPANIGTLLHARGHEVYVHYAGGSYSFQEVITFCDGGSPAGNTYICLLTPVSTLSYGGGRTIIHSTPTFISPPTFFAERGVYYLIATQGPTSDGKAKVGFFRIIHPQFFSRHFSSIPALVSLDTSGPYAVFTGKVTPPYDAQYWSLCIVALDDSSNRVVAASMKEPTTSEQWEISEDGINWTALPAGSCVQGRIYVRLTIPKSTLEYKRFVFEKQFPNKKWRWVFISEPCAV